MKPKPRMYIAYNFYFKTAPKITIHLPIFTAEDTMRIINKILQTKLNNSSPFIVIENEITFDSTDLVLIKKLNDPSSAAYVSDPDDEDDDEEKAPSTIRHPLRRPWPKKK